MNADNYPPLNVLSVFKSIHSEKLPYKITPYRFMMKSGESFKISNIRHYHRDRKGKGEHFHYVVEVAAGRYFRILFDTNTFTWRLIQEVEMGNSVVFKEVKKKWA